MLRVWFSSIGRHGPRRGLVSALRRMQERSCVAIIEALQAQATAHAQAGELPAAEELLDQLNGWLVDSGQLKSYGVDTEAFLAEAQE